MLMMWESAGFRSSCSSAPVCLLSRNDVRVSAKRVLCSHIVAEAAAHSSTVW